MEIETVSQELKKIGNSFLTENNNIECYIFGSALYKNCPNDFDILIIYDNVEQLKLIKSKIKHIINLFPLHLNYFTFLEEKELNFIKQQNATRIF